MDLKFQVPTAPDLVSITCHIHNYMLFLLWFHPFILSGIISPLISSSILGTYRPGEFISQYLIFLPFHAVYGVLKARILKWFAIPFSSGSHSVRDQIANICWIIEKEECLKKKIYFCFTDYVKAFDCVDHNKQWKILKEMGISDHLSCLLRNLVRKQQLELDMEQQTGSK